METVFESTKLYRPKDLSMIGSCSTLAQWRFARTGPKFIKLGSNVAYKGEDLNAWLQERTVETVH